MSGYWEGREPCWLILGCSKFVYPNCPGYLHREKPCWEHAGTYCKKLLNIKWECKDCKVFKIYKNSQD